MNRNVSCFLGCEWEYAAAATVLFGAPYDGTTSYRPGARFASRVMRAESYGLESYSPYQDRDLGDVRVFDGGDLELPFGAPEPVLEEIRSMTDRILEDGKRPFMVGGEHLVTLGALRAVAARYRDLAVIHLDAHADLRDDYLGQPLSHATVMRRIWELVGDGSIWQMGIRSGEREEFRFARKHVHTCRYGCGSVREFAEQIGGRPVYLTLDLDILDPSIFPGTGTPEAGGISFMQLLDTLFALKDLNIVAADLTELSPPYDISGCSTAAACKVLREMLLMLG